MNLWGSWKIRMMGRKKGMTKRPDRSNGKAFKVEDAIQYVEK